MNTSKYWHTHRVQLLFFMLLATIAVAAFGLVWVHQFFPKNIPMSAEIIISTERRFFIPESTEKFVFIILASVVPIIVLIFSMASWKENHIKNSNYFLLAQKFLPWIVTAFLFIPFIGSEFITIIIGQYKNPHSYGNIGVVVASMVAATACIWFVLAPRSFAGRKWRVASVSVAWIIFLSAVALQLLAWRLVGIASVTRSDVWSIHADPVFYPLTQVVAGKTLLVDLPSQYGLFPEILAPLFKLVGLSVFKLTAVFAVMQLVSLGAVYFVLSRLLGSRLLLIATGLALVTLTFESVLYFFGLSEHYYQYWPVRFFWPAISVLVFYFFSHKKTLVRGCIVSLAGAIGLLWNFDTGLFIIIAYGAYLVARLVVVLVHSRRTFLLKIVDQWNAKKYLFAIFFHVLIILIVVAGFFTALAWKAHQWLDLSVLFKYQKIFYSFGFMMLPMPRSFDPWMSVLGLYLLGLLTSLVAWRDRIPRVKDDVLFYLSMLGLGLFIYYQGRSHVLNLVSVFWPAALIAAILADETLRAIRVRLLPMAQICLPIAVISLLLLACTSFAVRVPYLLHQTINQFTTRGVAEDQLVSSELAFIRRHAEGQHECLILSKRQGIYYAETGLASPLKGPGFVEIILTEDQDQLIAQILSGSIKCLFLGIGKLSGTGFKLDAQKMREKYLTIATNPENTMQYLQSKPWPWP